MKKGIFYVFVMILVATMLLVGCQNENMTTTDVTTTGVTTGATTTSKVANHTSESDENHTPELIVFDVFSSIKVMFEGVTGYGVADIVYDESMPYFLKENLSYSVSSSNELVNGQKITVNLLYDSVLLERYGYQLKEDFLTYTVYGLQELIYVDPFEGLVVNSNGISPFGSISLDNADCSKDAQRYVNYNFAKEYYANGDSVVINATIDEDVTRSLGYAVSEDSKEFTLSGMPYYLETMEGVDVSSIEAELRDSITSQTSFITNDELFGVRANSFCEKYIGKSSIAWIYLYTDVLSVQSKEAHLLTIKERQKQAFLEGDVSSYNRLTISTVCKAVAGIQNSENQQAGDIYLTFSIHNIIVYPDGSLGWGKTDPASHEITYSSTLTSLEKLVESTVTKYVDTYNIKKLDKNDWISIQ